MNAILGLLVAFSFFTAPTSRLHPVIYRPVPYEWVLDFLAWDTTDLNEYRGAGVFVDGKLVQDSYVCSDFARDLVTSARHQGIASWTVVVYFMHEIGHVITVFATTDRGLVYVEPQSDTIYPVVAVGHRLCSADENVCFGGIEPVSEIIMEVTK
jgi:hypothetical protein